MHLLSNQSVGCCIGLVEELVDALVLYVYAGACNCNYNSRISSAIDCSLRYFFGLFCGLDGQYDVHISHRSVYYGSILHIACNARLVAAK